MLLTFLKKGEDRRIRSGHPWIFSNEIQEARGEKTPGAVTEVYDFESRFIGTGLYNPNSLISIRLFAWQRVDLDSQAFYRDRIEKALRYRRDVYPDLRSFRVVYGEADFLPGLVVDKYEDYLVVQFLTQGMDKRKQLITAVLVIFSIRAGLLRGMMWQSESWKEWRKMSRFCTDRARRLLQIEEHGLRFRVDIMGGQKTGHFLDQKNNHLLLKTISSGKRCAGLFLLHRKLGNSCRPLWCRAVTFLDASQRALSLAQENASINGISGNNAI